MVTKYDDHELKSLLFDVIDRGYTVIHLSKLYRLLDKGNRSAGTWVALLDTWEAMREQNSRDELHICEITGQNLLITKQDLNSVQLWAGED